MSNASVIGLLQNTAILLAMALVFDLATVKMSRLQSRSWQVGLGLVLGSIGIILMMTPWVFVPGIIFDTRSVLLGISGLFFGPMPTFIAVLMTGAFRIYQGGAAVPMGVSVIVTTGLIGVLWGHFQRKPKEMISLRELLLFGLVLHIDMLACAFVLPLETALTVLSNIAGTVLTIYPLATVLLGWIMTNRLRREQAVINLSRSEARLKSLVEIIQHSPQQASGYWELALQHALQLTNSEAGMAFLFDEETQALTACARASRDGVTAQDLEALPESQFSLDQVGMWAEAVRRRKPVIFNDYLGPLPLMPGLPLARVPMNYLALPVMISGQVVAVVGVAGNDAGYDEADLLQLTVLMDGVWKFIQWKHAEDELRKNEQKFRLLFEQAADGIIITDWQNRLIDVNENGCAMLGYTREEMLNMSMHDLFAADIQTSPLKLTMLNEGDVVVSQRRIRHKNGSLLDIEISGRRLPDGRYQGVLRNVTERTRAEQQLMAAQGELQQLLNASDLSRRALLSVVEDQRRGEEEIRQLNQELEIRVRDRTAQLETANKELEAFAYSVSHDLRAPLRALEGFSGALLSDYAAQLDEKGLHYLERIQQASQRMGQLIEDLLKLSRITRRELNRRQVDLGALASNIASELASQDPARQVETIIKDSMQVLADPDLMRIALENLLHNAFKFTAKCEHPRIEVGVLEKDPERIFFVRDNGTGFDMNYANKLFIPFQRLHSLQEYPGTGIGLVTVQRIVTRHGGRIWPEAQINQGATFYFTLGEKA